MSWVNKKSFLVFDELIRLKGMGHKGGGVVEANCQKGPFRLIKFCFLCGHVLIIIFFSLFFYRVWTFHAQYNRRKAFHNVLRNSRNPTRSRHVSKHRRET